MQNLIAVSRIVCVQSAHIGSVKIIFEGDAAPLGHGVVDSLRNHTKFRRSRSNHLGVCGRVSKHFWEAGTPLLWDWGVADP